MGTGPIEGPSFQGVQAAFAAHIRDPDRHAPPPDVEPRRMAIYARLFYSNVESALAGTHGTLKALLGDERWHGLMRGFLRDHHADSPYFSQLSEEFLAFLAEREPEPALPPFAVELCHYEWLSLALRLAPDADCDFDDRALDQGEPLALSPLAWPLRYDYPVMRIGPDFQPAEPPPEATHLIACRDRHDEVRFIAANALTLRLLQLIEEAEGGTPRECLGRLAKETDAVLARLESTGLALLNRLHRQDVVVRAHPPHEAAS